MSEDVSKHLGYLTREERESRQCRRKVLEDFKHTQAHVTERSISVKWNNNATTFK